MLHIIADLDNGSVMAQYWEILTSPSHLLAELTIEFASACLGFIYAKGWVKRHDERKHGIQ